MVDGIPESRTGTRSGSRFISCLLAGSLWLVTGGVLVRGTSADSWIPGPGWTPVWADEFNGTAVDRTNWTFDLGAGGWGNHELETYTQASATVQGGELLITARQNPDGTYTSARLKTQGLHSWTYGKIAARMRLPKGQGMWPAFWMLGSNFPTVGWPKCGEIDIMEMIGGGPGRDDSIYGTIHWDANGHAQAGSGRQALPFPQIFNDDYHVFEIEWSSTDVTWKLDGMAYARASVDLGLWPARTAFHRDFFIILNLAVGGDWPGSPDSTTLFPQTMAVDWVRVYAGAPAPSAPAITLQPLSQTINTGQSVTFSVAASGNPIPVFQWQKNSLNIANATSASYSLSNVTTADAANYSAVATNLYGSAVSDAAALTVATPAPVTTPPAPTPPPPAPKSSGGGGGAPSLWFPAALLVLHLARRHLRLKSAAGARRME